MNIKPGLWLLGAAVAPVAAVGMALFTQHVLGMMPCPWCVLQRVIFLAISLAALTGLLLRAPWPRRAAATAQAAASSTAGKGQRTPRLRKSATAAIMNTVRWAGTPQPASTA